MTWIGLKFWIRSWSWNTGWLLIGEDWLSVNITVRLAIFRQFTANYYATFLKPTSN